MALDRSFEQLYGHPWNEREYIVALDYYFQHGGDAFDSEAGYIQEMSRLLGRTPASCVMRMGNFASLDPKSSRRKGLVNVGPFCSRVFADWLSRREALHACAEVFRREMGDSPNLNLFDAREPMPGAFGKYEILDFIGEGGSARVFSCLDPISGKTYALKIIKMDRRYDSEALYRFRREIRILRSIDHPNLIKLHEDNLDTEKDYPGFIMDLATRELRSYLQDAAVSAGRPAIDQGQAALIMRSVLSAVERLHAHSPSVLHRDINPGNVLQIENGNWCLADFGLAKVVGGPQMTSFTTMTQVGYGTMHYAAPEQYRDLKSTDERTDIYALGFLLWDLFSSAWPPPDRLDNGLPDKVAAVFRRATERDPNERYQSVTDLTEDFEAALARPQ